MGYGAKGAGGAKGDASLGDVAMGNSIIRQGWRAVVAAESHSYGQRTLSSHPCCPLTRPLQGLLPGSGTSPPPFSPPLTIPVWRQQLGGKNNHNTKYQWPETGCPEGWGPLHSTLLFSPSSSPVCWVVWGFTRRHDAWYPPSGLLNRTWEVIGPPVICPSIT